MSIDDPSALYADPMSDEFPGGHMAHVWDALMDVENSKWPACFECSAQYCDRCGADPLSKHERAMSTHSQPVKVYSL